MRVPKYRRVGKHYARVTINGRDVYLGRFGTEESRAAYARVISEWQAGNSTPSMHCTRADCGEAVTIVELIAGYFDHAIRYYGDTGTRRGTANNLKPTLRALKDLYGDEPATEFGPLKLKALQQHWISIGHSRTYVNDQTGVIKRLFKWAAEHELIPVAVYQSVATVSNLKAGRSQARETPPVPPVADSVVDATQDEAHAILVAMVRIQRLTGMRPNEVCQLRPCDVDRSREIWLFTPEKHKTQHHGKKRIVAIGPRAQNVLMPYLLRDAGEFCFRPRDVTKGKRARLRYTVDSYRQAIQRAAQRAGVPKWAPNQLRHTAATEIREQFGIEAAQHTLGHSRAEVTEIYAERNLQLAADVAKRIG